MKDDQLNRCKVKRGSALPQSKLDESDIVLIRALIAEREELRRQASLLTNAKLADKFGVYVRTIDRISAGEGWTHV